MALPAVIFDQPQRTLIRQSCLAAFYNHVRMLAEFFAPPPKKPRPDDRNAVHFTTGSPWSPDGSALDRLLAVSRDVNKQIAHVTTVRAGDGADEAPASLLLEPDSAQVLTDEVRRLWDDLVTHTDVPLLRVGSSRSGRTSTGSCSVPPTTS